ncbi:hypothetical protein ACFX2I_006584 [Malus domestica]
MSVDTDPFPTATVNMVDACLPKDKGKGKAEAVATQHFQNQNSRPHFMADFRSNEPPTALTGPAIVKPMMDYSTDEDSGTTILCSKCRAKVNIEPEGKSSPLIMEQPTAATQQKTPSVRRCLDFDASFYDNDYYICNSSSSESSLSQKTFKPPEPRDQRWYTYHSSKGVYTALSKSQKHQHQIIDCMARRRATQKTAVHKWRSKDTISIDDERPPPTIMTELVQGKWLVNQDIETMFEEVDKRIKLLLRPGDMKARLEHFRQEAESKLTPPATQEP